MTHAVHLSEDLIGRVVDDELTPTERLFVERHLAKCAACRQKRREWAEVAERVQDLVLEQEPVVPANARQRLVSALEQREPAQVAPISARRARLVEVGCGCRRRCIARVHAIPAAGADAREWTIEPREQGADWLPQAEQASQARRRRSGALFRLPYSGVALAEGEEEIVRVQLPASALANAGDHSARRLCGKQLGRCRPAARTRWAAAGDSAGQCG